MKNTTLLESVCYQLNVATDAPHNLCKLIDGKQIFNVGHYYVHKKDDNWQIMRIEKEDGTTSCITLPSSARETYNMGNAYLMGIREGRTLTQWRPKCPKK